MQIVQNGARKLQAAPLLQYFKDELLLFLRHAALLPACRKEVEQLIVVRLRLEHVDDRHRVLPFVEVLAESFLASVLQNEETVMLGTDNT